jgi:tetratricopeptide (TPR) repeat protein
MPLQPADRLRLRGLRTRRCVLSAILLAAACTARPTTSIGSLESRLAQAPDATDTRLHLAAAYRADGRAADAVEVLEPAVREVPHDPAMLFVLARSYENAGRLSDARATLERFLTVSRSSRLNRRVRARIELLRRRELEQVVRTALADEATLRNAAPSPGVIGVFPLLATGADATLAPLGRALAEMLTTDLAQTDRLRVVERAGIQFLLDEIGLAASGMVDPLTGARAGRLLGAGRIVQGRLDGDPAQLRLEALVVALAEQRDSTTAPARVNGRLDDLFDLEKQLVLALYADLGIALTIAERERVLRRPTDNVQALLAFGLGLEADDANRWADAARSFERALELDGNFVLAREWLERSRRKAEAAQDDGGLDEQAEFELGWDLPSWLRMRLPFALIERIVPDPDLRNPAPELLRVEGLDRGSRIDVIIRPPGGR